MLGESQQLLVNDRHDYDATPNHFNQAGPAQYQSSPEGQYMDEEVLDSTDYDWKDYDEYKVLTDGSNKDDRGMSDMKAINKITRYYTKYLLEDMKPASDKAELKGLVNIKKHQVLFKENTFSWQLALPDMAEILSLVKTTISKFSHSFDIELLDHRLFQKLFPLKIIDEYLAVVNREYGKPVYDNALRFHTNLIEIFLWHHIKPDTRFHPKISTKDINLLDPFFRIKTRESNRADKKLMEKYFNAKFDLKKFVSKMLELYFPNVTWRYIGGGQEMHRWILLLLQYMLELGLYTADEMQDLVNILLQKLENLLVLEKRSYKDFDTSLKAYPKFNIQLKAYFYECKQIVAAISIQIVVLLNDEAFKESYPLYNPKLSIGKVPDPDQVWKKAYFSNTTIANILNRVMTTYLFQFTEKIESSQREDLFTYLNDFVMLTMDIENDLCFVSSKIVNQSMIEFYHSTPKPSLVEQADQLSKDLENLVDQVSFLNLNRKSQYTEANVLQGLKNFLIVLGQCPPGKEKDNLKYLLGMRSVPNILLALYSLVMEERMSKEVELVCGLALTEVCVGCTISQICAMNEQAMFHWQFIFSEKMLSGVMLQASIFGDDFTLFYTHRNTMKRLLDNFKAAIPTQWRVGSDKSSHTEWFDNFKKGILEEGNDSELDSLMTFFIYCRFVYRIADNHNFLYESKFHNLELQDILVGPFFNFLFKIIRDPEFLKESSGNGGGGFPSFGMADTEPQAHSYKVTTNLNSKTTAQILEFVGKAENKQITEHELRSAVFEVAMLTMKLLNKACSGLFQYWIYKTHVKDSIGKLLDDTEYMFEIQDGGLLHRAAVLTFYKNFRIFPNNGLMTGRDAELKDPAVSREVRLVASHKDGTIVNEIIKELKMLERIEKMEMSKKLEDDMKYYYFLGVMAVIYKYVQGVYTTYTQEAQLDKLKEDIISLRHEFEKNKDVLRDKFDIKLTYTDLDLNVGINAILKKEVKPSPSQEYKFVRSRMPDDEERLYPNLTKVRDDCEELILLLETSYRNCSLFNVEAFFLNFSKRCMRDSVIYSNKQNQEPWIGNSSSSESVTKIKKLTATQVENALDLARLVVSKAALDSSEINYYYNVMKQYQEKKSFYLQKPLEDNIFLKFLESKSGYTPNVIIFLARLIERFYSKLLDYGDKTPTAEEVIQNQDFLVKTYLQNDILHSIVTFFSLVLADCVSIRESLYKALASQEESDSFSKSILSLFFFTTKSLAQLSLCKTFMDTEYNIVLQKYETLAKFMKNTCENNHQKFKKLLGTFVPKVKGLPNYNSGGKCLFFDAYVMMETMLNNFNFHLNTVAQPQMTDRPEVFKVLVPWFRFISEVANGPCLQNQKQVYIYRTDFYVGAVKRNIDNINSNLYQLKSTVLDYIRALTEGNNGNEEIITHFASNFTFDIVFDLICTTIKRLYIHCSHRSKSQYSKLSQNARYHRIKKEKERQAREDKANLLHNEELKYYLSNEEKEGQSLKTDSSQLSENVDLLETTCITEEILDYVKIDDYEDVMEMYLKNKLFSSHVLIEIVFKLNEFLIKFAESIAGYKISLENVYTKMIDSYGDKVPLHIRNRLGHYEEKTVTEIDEKIAIYMFLSMITAEIELANPETNQKTKIFFPLKPMTFFLTDQTKSEFYNDADPSNMMVDLIQTYQCFEIEMTDNLALYRKFSLLYYMTSDDAFFYYKIVLWCLGMLLNLLLIIYYRKDESGSKIIDQGNSALIVLASVIIFFSFLSLIMWIISRYSQKAKIAAEKLKMEHQVISRSAVRKFFHIYLKKSLIYSVYPSLFLWHIISCFLGLFVERFFYTLQVLTVIFLSQTMGYVVQATTLHFGQLAQTVLLMVLVIYCYSVLSAEYFFDAFQSNAPGSSYQNCTQLWECLAYVFNNGLRMGGGVGDVTDAFNPLANEGRYVAKFFFDVVFFMLINVISLNIIFGIIIDTFADMREKNDEKGRPM